MEVAKRKRQGINATLHGSTHPTYVATNVGREFLKLIDLHFPPGHVLHSVINRSTVKVSYRCLPNMGAQVAKHNSKLLRNSEMGQAKPPIKCNCQTSKKKDCPLPGACNQEGVVYQAKVTNNKGETEKYIGIAKKFKHRYSKLKKSMKVKLKTNSTTLSTHFWKEKDEGKEPKIEWKILERNIPSFNPVNNTCKLCLREKFRVACHPNEARNFWTLKTHRRLPFQARSRLVPRESHF